MTCECGHADNCDGKHGILFPLQDGGECSVVDCRAQERAAWVCQNGMTLGQMADAVKDLPDPWADETPNDGAKRAPYEM